MSYSNHHKETQRKLCSTLWWVQWVVHSNHSNLSSLTVHLRHLVAFTDRVAEANGYSPKIFRLIWCLLFLLLFFSLFLMARGGLCALPPVSRLFSKTPTKLVPDSHITTLTPQFPLWNISATGVNFPTRNLTSHRFCCITEEYVEVVPILLAR